MTPQKRLLIGLSQGDVSALHDAWHRLQGADAERKAALVALYHLCSELGVLESRHLAVVPEARTGDRTHRPSSWHQAHHPVVGDPTEGQYCRGCWDNQPAWNEAGRPPPTSMSILLTLSLLVIASDGQPIEAELSTALASG